MAIIISKNGKNAVKVEKSTFEKCGGGNYFRQLTVRIVKVDQKPHRIYTPRTFATS